MLNGLWCKGVAPFAALSRRTRGLQEKGLRLPHRLLQILVDLVEKARRREPFLLGADEQRQILGHAAALHRRNANVFERLGEARERGVVVELRAMREAARPGEDRGDRIRRRRMPLLMLAIMARHRAMRS